MMHLGRIVPKLTLQQAYRIDRLELRIIVSGLELTCVDFTSVEYDPLDESSMRRQLHLDIVDRTTLPGRLRLTAKAQRKRWVEYEDI
jgi:hypothetical protein